MCTSRVLAAFVLALGGATVSASEPLVAVEFGDLRGVLTFQAGGTGGTFTAGAVNEPGRMTAGLVWRNVVPAGEALFDTGFVAEPNPADVGLTLSIGEIRAKRADVFGTVVFTDVDGDTLTMMLTGVMSFGDNGEVSTVVGIDSIAVAADEAMFDGTDGGSLSTADLGTARGSLVIDFSYAISDYTGGGRRRVGTASMNGEANGSRAVPAPSSVATLFCAGSLFATGLRRRPRIGGAPC